MATIHKKEMNYRIDFSRMTLIMTAEFAANAYDPTTAEYKVLTRLKKDFPDLKIERKTHRTPTKYRTKSGEEYEHNQFKDLTYKRMEKFLSYIPNGAKYQKEYDFVKDFATSMNGNGYTLVRKWFMKQFPNFLKNPMFYLTNSPDVLSGFAFMDEATTEGAGEESATLDNAG